MSKRVFFVLTSHDRKGPESATNAVPSGFYLSEVTHPRRFLTDAGYSVDYVSPKGGKCHADGLNLDDPVNAAFGRTPELRSATETTKRLSQVDPEEYAAIFYAGGHATMWDFSDNAALASIAARIYERGGVVSAAC